MGPTDIRGGGIPLLPPGGSAAPLYDVTEFAAGVLTKVDCEPGGRPGGPRANELGGPAEGGPGGGGPDIKDWPGGPDEYRFGPGPSGAA